MPHRVSWFSWPLLLGLGSVPILLAFKLEADAGLAILAYVNCVIGVLTLILVAKKGRVEAAVPILFLPLLLAAWPAASLYFTMFYPEMSYGLIDRPVRMLAGNDKIQLAVLLFLSGYLPVVFLSLWGAKGRPEGLCRNPGRIADVVAVIAVSILALNAVSKVVYLPPLALYVVDGLLIYSQGLLFLPGALITSVSRKVKLLLAISLPAIVFFYTLGNARGMALLPSAMFLFGVLFFSSLRQSVKFTVLAAVLFVFPLYVVIGNTTRMLTTSIGFKDLEKRWEALQRWDEVTQKTPAAATFGRLFFTGGHSLITRTPEERPFLEFNAGSYMMEWIEAILPGRYYYEPRYRGNRILSRYGFMITEQTSVEVSMLGNLWLLGGFIPVFFGGIAAGLLHWFLMGTLRLVRRKNGAMALLFLGVVGSKLLGAAGQDIISLWRTIIWHLIFAAIFWLVAATIAGHWRSRSPKEQVPG